jgi:hypothetical protein
LRHTFEAKRLRAITEGVAGNVKFVDAPADPGRFAKRKVQGTKGASLRVAFWHGVENYKHGGLENASFIQVVWNIFGGGAFDPLRGNDQTSAARDGNAGPCRRHAAESSR